MGFEDRDYYRQERPGPWGRVLAAFSWSMPLFTFRGVRVRAHATLVYVIALTVLFGAGNGLTSLGWRVAFPSTLFVIILLHEFGHVFACRWVGGEANDILMHPLGGLAMVLPPRRPWPDFATSAGGPAVNVVLLAVSAGVMYGVGGKPIWNPFEMQFAIWPEAHREVFGWAYWMFVVNYGLLLFNLIPSFPLDGGQILRAILWKPMGYYKAYLTSATIGLVGAGLMMAYGLMTGHFLLVFVGLMCLQMCVQTRRMLLAEGPYAFTEDEGDYSASQWSVRGEDQRAVKVAKKAGEVARKQEAAREKIREKRQAEVRSEQEVIDRILAKVHAQGMASLTGGEKKALADATEKQRQRAAGR